MMPFDADTMPLVLIVEDEMLIAAMLEAALQSSGYRVLGPVSTVEQALALLERNAPRLALIDYRLAGSTTESLLPVLDARGIRSCVITGYGRTQLPAAYGN